mmetsp:Transcript_14994/g.29947  ORF Transcript_14994/g.29947 Transcript_14994/m.29947 type:complete len:204 (+) Transcript_14994:507-1118(+)
MRRHRLSTSSPGAAGGRRYRRHFTFARPLFHRKRNAPFETIVGTSASRVRGIRPAGARGGVRVPIRRGRFGVYLRGHLRRRSDSCQSGRGRPALTVSRTRGMGGWGCARRRFRGGFRPPRLRTLPRFRAPAPGGPVATVPARSPCQRAPRVGRGCTSGRVGRCRYRRFAPGRGARAVPPLQLRVSGAARSIRVRGDPEAFCDW